MINRVVLAFQGGAAAGAELSRLAALGREVVTLTLDLGEGPALEAIRDRALAAGAARAHVLDVRDEFAREYLLPALRAGVLAADGASPRPALHRALLARKLAEIAALEAAAVAPAPADPAPADPPRRPGTSETVAHVEIAFAGGVPDALNGVTMPLTELFGSLATIAAEHGIASADAVLQPAHGELLHSALPPDIVGLSADLRGRYAELLAAGRWFAPLRAALDAFFIAAQAPATGAVRMKLFKGECAAVSVSAEGPHDYTLVGPV